MEPETLTIIFKGIGMVLALFGGIAIGYYGFRLYKDGAGTGRGSAAFEVGPVKVKAHSVGSVVMATAFLWAWAGVALSPNLEKENDRIHVYSFHAPVYKVEAESVVTTASASDWMIEKDPQKMMRVFREALRKRSPSKQYKLKLNDQPAHYDLNSIKVEQTNYGNYFVTAKVKNESSWASLSFEPTNISGQLAFVPTGVEKSSSCGSDPNQSRHPDRLPHIQ